MMKTKLPIVLYIVLGLVVAGLAALGYGYTSLRSERNALLARASELENRIVLLDKKYSEKRALEQQLTRARAQVEGQVRGLQGELEKLRREKELLLEEKTETEEDLEKMRARAASLEASVKALAEKAERLTAGAEAAEKLHAKALKDQQQELERVLAEKKKTEAELQSALRVTQEKLERSESNNAKLVIIAQELVEKYKNKGITAPFLQAEPFTQIGKVEMENLVEEYKERIESEKLKKSSAKKP
jgi:chromosome segregation ATPase